jgi:hypothetical protein
MARRSCPLEGFEQCDTVPDELKKLNRSFLALFRILGDPIKLDLFSKSRITKHCKWARDDSVETQFLLLCRPSCGIIRRLVVAPDCGMKHATPRCVWKPKAMCDAAANVRKEIGWSISTMMPSRGVLCLRDAISIIGAELSSRWRSD